MKVAEAKIKTAELELSFTRITSPHHRPHQPHAGDGRQLGERRLGTANATLLTTIVSEDPIYVYFDVSENNYIKYKRLTERGVGAGSRRSRRRRSRWRCPTSAASRTRPASTSSTTASTRAPARCAPAP